MGRRHSCRRRVEAMKRNMERGRWSDERRTMVGRERTSANERRTRADDGRTSGSSSLPWSARVAHAPWRWGAIGIRGCASVRRRLESRRSMAIERDSARYGDVDIGWEECDKDLAALVLWEERVREAGVCADGSARGAAGASRNVFARSDAASEGNITPPPPLKQEETRLAPRFYWSNRHYDTTHFAYLFDRIWLGLRSSLYASMLIL